MTKFAVLAAMALAALASQSQACSGYGSAYGFGSAFQAYSAPAFVQQQQFSSPYGYGQQVFAPQQQFVSPPYGQQQFAAPFGYGQAFSSGYGVGAIRQRVVFHRQQVYARPVVVQRQFAARPVVRQVVVQRQFVQPVRRGLAFRSGTLGLRFFR